MKRRDFIASLLVIPFVAGLVKAVEPEPIVPSYTIASGDGAEYIGGIPYEFGFYAHPDGRLVGVAQGYFHGAFKPPTILAPPSNTGHYCMPIRPL